MIVRVTAVPANSTIAVDAIRELLSDAESCGARSSGLAADWVAGPLSMYLRCSNVRQSSGTLGNAEEGPVSD